MSTTITALPQRTLRPFLAGALTAMLMAGLVIGIALAINLSANRTSQATQKSVPVVVNDTYQEHRSGVIVPVIPDVTGCYSYAMDNCGPSTGDNYVRSFTSDNGGPVAGSQATNGTYFDDTFTAGSGTSTHRTGPTRRTQHNNSDTDPANLKAGDRRR